MEENREHKPSLDLRLVLNLVLCFGRPWRTLMARPGTQGYREVNSINALWGTLSLFLWWVFWPADGVLFLLAASVLAQAVHKAKTPRRQAVSSRYIGDSAFSRFTASGVRAWWLAHLFAVGCGLVAFEMEKSTGAWLVASGVANLASLMFVSLKEDAVRHDIRDSMLEGLQRAR